VGHAPLLPPIQRDIVWLNASEVRTARRRTRHRRKARESTRALTF
jgi:hypothetical protein